MVIVQNLQDSNTCRIPLRFQSKMFIASDHHLTFTAKSSNSDTDAEALMQLESGNGIIYVSGYAVVEITPEHTSMLVPQRNIQWDIQAEDTLSNSVRTVARGTLHLLRDITRELTPNINVGNNHYLSPLGSAYQSPDGALYLQPAT